jgi:hypothetical protein
MPVAPARQLVQALVHCQVTVYADTGHLSKVIAHVDDIVGALRVCMQTLTLRWLSILSEHSWHMPRPDIDLTWTSARPGGGGHGRPRAVLPVRDRY